MARPRLPDNQVSNDTIRKRRSRENKQKVYPTLDELQRKADRILNKRKEDSRKRQERRNIQRQRQKEQEREEQMKAMREQQRQLQKELEEEWEEEWQVKLQIEVQSMVDRVRENELMQEQLFNRDDRRSKLERLWSFPCENSNSHFADLSATGMHILTGSPARPYWDYTYVTNERQLKAVLSAFPPKPILYDNKEWYNSLPNRTTVDQFVKHTLAGYDMIEVQDFGKESASLNQHMLTGDFQHRWSESNGEITEWPMNALNISAANYECTPRPLLAQCNLLHELVERVLANKVGANTTVSKRSTKNLEVAADTEGCLRFQILAQAGCFSGWHMDMVLGFTWVTLEGTVGENSLKYWAVVNMDHLSQEEQNAIRAEFAEKGSKWLPRRDIIAVISLTPGMTLIMRPGTIHAPISITNCLFRGGMCWDRKSFVEYTLPNFEFVLKHRNNVTNEDPHKQIPAILEMAIKDIKDRFPDYGLQSTQVANVIERCKAIAEMARPCRCRKLCSQNCRCRSFGHICSRYCTCKCEDK